MEPQAPKVRKPYGLEEPPTLPPGKIQRHQTVMDPLEVALVTWLKGLRKSKIDGDIEKDFKSALKLLDSVNPNPAQAEQVVALHKDHPRIQRAGAFLSACYHISSATEISYMGCGDLELESLGFLFPKGKSLVIQPGVRLGEIGRESYGTIVMGGYAREWGNGQNGLMIHTGETQKVHCGFYPCCTGIFQGKIDLLSGGWGGPVILMGEIGVLDSFSADVVLSYSIPLIMRNGPGLILGAKELKKIPAMREHIEALVRPFSSANSISSKLEASGRLNPEKITAHIYSVLREAGYSQQLNQLTRRTFGETKRGGVFRLV